MPKNTKEFIIHLGLPKTASTALQDYHFANLATENVCFLGKSVKADICHPALLDLRYYIDGRRRSAIRYKKRFRVAIQEIDADIIVISDEMLLVDSAKCNWQTKLTRLSRLISECNFEMRSVLIVHRCPIDAVYSMYVETYGVVGARYKTLSRYVTESNQALIYKYGYLHNEVAKNFDVEKIVYYPYSDISKGQNVRRLLDAVGLRSNSRNAQQVNKKDVVDGNYVTNRQTLKEVLLSHWIIRTLVGVIPRRIYRSVAIQLSRINARSGKVIERPGLNERERLSKALLQGIDVFSARAGIDYREW